MKTNLLGPDVSFYQDKDNTPIKIDFEKMRSAGCSFVIIRAGQNTWVDSDFQDSWRRAKGILPRGTYWFYDSRSKPADQAKLWSEAVGDDPPECGVWLDFEESYDGPYGSEKHFRDFAEAVKDLFPTMVEVGVYTAYYYWLDRVTQFDYWHQYPAWVANYGVSSPLVPRPWKPDEWTFWQFTDSGDGPMYGAESSRIDLNYFNGGLPEFSQIFGYKPESLPPPDTHAPNEGDPMSYLFSITPDTTSGNTIRSDHTVPVTNNKIGALAYGRKAYGNEKWGDGVNALWLHILEYEDANGARKPLDGWIASIHNGKKVATIVTIETPPPPPEPKEQKAIATVILQDNQATVEITVSPDVELSILVNGVPR